MQQQPPNQQPPFYYGTPPQMGAYQPPQQNWQPMPPPKKKSKLPAIGCLALIAFIALIIGISTAASTAKPSTVLVQPTPNGTHVLKKASAMPKATQKAAQFTVTHGTPRVGGPISDFYGKYGNPDTYGIGGGPTFTEDHNEQTYIIGTFVTNGKVTQLNISGDQGWTDQQTRNYVSQFLPDDAVSFNVVDNIIDYHSSTTSKMIVLKTLGGGVAMLYLGE